MKKRGKLGGKPRAITVEELRERRQVAPDPKVTQGLPPDENYHCGGGQSNSEVGTYGEG